MAEFGFAIALPDEWLELEGPNISAEEALRTGLNDAVASAVGVDKAELRRTFVWWLRQARRKGLALVAAFADEIEAIDEGSESTADASPDADSGAGAAESVVIGALVSLSFMSRAALGVEGLQTLNPGVLIAALERQVSAEWEPLRPPGRVELSCGTAVERPRLFKTDEGVVLEISYYIPLADGDMLSLLSFVTPSVFVADEFIELFRTIADTLEVFDETDFDAESPTGEAAPAY